MLFHIFSLSLSLSLSTTCFRFTLCQGFYPLTILPFPLWVDVSYWTLSFRIFLKMATQESNQFIDVDFNSSSTGCSSSVTADHLTPLGSRGDTGDEYNSEEEKPTFSEKKLPTCHINEWRLEITKKNRQSTR